MNTPLNNNYNNKGVPLAFENNSTLNLSLATSHPVLCDLADDLYTSWLINVPKRTRQVTKDKTKQALHSLVANLFKAHWAAEDMVSCSLNENHYHGRTKHGITWTPFENAFDVIRNEWELEENCFPRLTIHHPGFFNHETGYGDNSKIQLNPDCLSTYLLKRYGIEMTENIDPLSYVFSIGREKEEEGLMPITNGLNSLFHFTTQLPLISLRDELGRPMAFDATEETECMSAALKAYNRRLRDARVSLFIKDEDYTTLAAETRAKLTDRRRQKDMTLTMARLLGWESTQLYRVFNHSTFDRGGRFYGGWWQNIPSKYRPYITIDGWATAELDYKGLHPTMMYHLSGLDAPEDPYLIEGIRPGKHRSTVKSFMMALINAKPSARNLQSVHDLQYPDGWDWRRMKEAIEKAHAPISSMFKSGVGVELQRKDSDIAELVMREMWRKHRSIVLPVHDSFIVDEHYSRELEEEMVSAYEAIMGTCQIRIDRKPSIWDKIGDHEETGEGEFLFLLGHYIDRFPELQSDFFGLPDPVARDRQTFLSLTLRNRSIPDTETIGVDAEANFEESEWVDLDDLDFDEVLAC